MESKLVWRSPVQEDSLLHISHTWWTECGRYCVRLTRNKCGAGDSFRAGYKRTLERHDGSTHEMLDTIARGKEGNYPATYKTLEEAISAVEAFIFQSQNLQMTSNQEDIIAHAQKLGLAELTQSVRMPVGRRSVEKCSIQQSEELHMLNRNQTVAMLKECVTKDYPQGYPMAEKWENERILKKLRSLPDILAKSGDDAGPKSAAGKAVLQTVLNTLKAKKKLALDSENGEAAGDGKASSKKETKKSASKVSSKGEKKEDVDKYGARAGSVMAKVNAVLGKKPKTMAQIIAEAKIDRECYGHMRSLVEKGIVKKSDEGFYLAAK